MAIQTLCRRLSRRRLKQAIITDPVASAQAVGLRYVTDNGPGIQRRRSGKGFRYIDPDGRPIRDPQELRRIQSLAIPPAYREVWICPLPHGHLQATGRDARGRKQYRYHPRWCEIREQTKFTRMLLFSQYLPSIRERVERDLALPGLPRHKVLATVVSLLEMTRIRVGNEEYARANQSYGLTTLRHEHVQVQGATIRFHFRGKSGVEHEVTVRDRRLARIVKRCEELPGQELFQYLDETGQRQAIDSGDVNGYLKEITGQDFTAKDFRTWGGTVIAALELEQLGRCNCVTQAKKNIVQAVKQAARHLGNRPAICRKYYVHPAVLDAYLDESLFKVLEQRERFAVEAGGLRPEEKALVAVLELQLARLASTNQ